MSVCVRAAVATLVFVLSWLWLGTAQAGEAQGLYWHAPAQVRTLPWPIPEGANHRTWQSHDTRQPVQLQPGEVLLVPIRTGDIFEVNGNHYDVGWVFGSLEFPDAIVWQGLRKQREQIRVPTWGYARFIAVRVELPQQVQVRVAVPQRDQLAFHRLDTQIGAVLQDPKRALPQVADGQGADLLHALSAQRDILFDAIAEAPASRRPALRRAAVDVLSARWLTGSYLVRPLMRPYFLERPVQLKGARGPGHIDAQGVSWVEVDRGTALELRADADVLRIKVSVWAGEDAHYQIFAGQELIGDHIRLIPERSTLRERWTPFKATRVVLRGNEATRIVAVAGRLRVAYKAVDAQVGLLEGGKARSPRMQLAAALQDLGPNTSSGAASLLRVLIEDELKRSDTTWAALVAKLRGEHRPAVRALLWSALLPRFLPERSVAEQLRDFWEVSAALPAPASYALRHWVLSQIVESRDAPQVAPTEVQALRELMLQPHAYLTGDLALTHRAWVDLVVPPQDGLRPSLGAELEARAAAQPSRKDYRRIARRWWRGVTPWAGVDPVVEPPSELRWQVPKPEQLGQLCPIEGPLGLRWSVVDGSTRSVEVQPTSGTHLSVPLRALPRGEGDVPMDSKLDVSGIPVSVLGFPVELSRVYLAPGKHPFQVTRGPPVLARIPAHGQAPCGDLREARRWYKLGGPVTFDVPLSGGATVASLVVEPRSVPHQGATLSLRVGDREYQGWVNRPGTGALEVAVPPDARSVTVSSEFELLVRMRVRLHRAAPGGPGAPKEATPKMGSAPPSFRERVAAIRRLTMKLRSAETPEQRAELRTRRAKLLVGVGYSKLAERDAERRRGFEEPLGLDELPPGEAWWPHREERVIASTRASRVPLMPNELSPGESRQVSALLEARQDGDAASTLQRLLQGRAVGRGAQLHALLLERQRRYPDAGNAFEKLALAAPAAEHFAAAAEMRTIEAAELQDEALTDRAHYLARRAIALGAREVSLLAPLAGTIGWTSPSPASLGEGAVWVHSAGEYPPAESESRQVRAAVLGKPDRSRWLSPNSSLGLFRFRGRELSVATLCFAQEVGAEPCETKLELDGQPVSCIEDGAPASSAANDAVGDGVSVPRRCRIAVPVDARRLRLVTDPARAPMGYWSASIIDKHGKKRLVPARQSYSRISPAVPLEMHVRAPTVVRVRARAEGIDEATLMVSATRADAGLASEQKNEGEVLGARQRWNLRLWGELDPNANWPDTEEPEDAREYPLQYEKTDYVVVEGGGLQRLSIVPNRPGILVKVELPRVKSPPELDALDPVLGPAGPAPVRSAFQGFSFPRPLEPRKPWPLTLSGDLSIIDRDLAEADADARDRYMELSIAGRKELVPGRLWARVSGLSRLRDGPTSVGAKLFSTLATQGVLPGGYLRATIVGQSFDDVNALGGRFTVGGVEAIDLHPQWTLLPGAAFTVRSGDDRVLGRRGSDRDVASAYTSTHPSSLDLMTTLAHRPYFDTRGRYGALVRINPHFDGVDRAQLEARFDWLGGQGWAPWITWQTTLGYRPVSPLRDVGFFRVWTSPSAMVWHWLDNGGRIRARATAGAYLDTPGGADGLALFGSLNVGYDWTTARGVADFAVLERPHRARLEEGASRVTTAPPVKDDYWRADEAEGLVVSDDTEDNWGEEEEEAHE